MDEFSQLLLLPIPVDVALEKAALTVSELTAAGRQTDPKPTEAALAAGNYRKGKVRWKGLDISIETAKGVKRRPEWAPLKDHYGYIRRMPKSEADGDHVDIFLCDEHLDSDLVFVVNQNNADGGFDEHKVIGGVLNEDHARKVYLRNYEPGWTGLGSITALTIDQFKHWLEHGDTGRPLKPEHVAVNRKKAASAEAQICFLDPRLVLVKWAQDADGPFTIAVDLDGTLAEAQDTFDPETIGAPRARAIDWLRRFHRAGARIIIWTVRGDTELVEAWLDEHDVPFDFINENPDQPEGSSAKIFAHAYFDDRGFNATDPDEHGPEILQRILAHGTESSDSAPDVRISVVRNTYIIAAPDLLEALESDHGETEQPGCAA